MKLLVHPALQTVSALLGHIDTGDSVVQGRIEAYSCKRASSDKKLSGQLERKYSDQPPGEGGKIERAPSSGSVERQYSGFTPILSSSGPGSAPDEFVLGESPGMGEDGKAGSLGVIPDYSMRKLFINLLLTLSNMYPDYDFSCVRPEEFVEETNFDLVMHSINSALAKVLSTDATIGPTLWAAIEDAIQPSQCSIYSYIPDVESSPFGENSLWSFNYFFFNKSLKRVLFFTCSCARPGMRMDATSGDETGSGYEDLEFRETQMDFDMEDM